MLKHIRIGLLDNVHVIYRVHDGNYRSLLEACQSIKCVLYFES